MHRLVLMTMSLLVLTLSGCRREVEKPATEEKSTRQKLDDLSSKVDELKGLLVDLKQGNQGAEAEYRKWLDQNLAPGKTTLTDVQQLFGADYLNLDRPDRDDILTIQYPIDGLAGKKLVLDFTKQAPSEHWLFGRTYTSSKQGAFDFWCLQGRPEFSFAICGYCPHILVDADGWRLDGKILAGAIGPNRERSDTLVLPRARVRHEMVHVKLANWAPEVEYLDQLELGFVASQTGEDLDFDASGAAYLWQRKDTVQFAGPDARADRDHWQLKFDAQQRPELIVLEVRNTEKFQNLARECYSCNEEPAADLQVDGARPVVIPPVGTKFLRRVVIPVAADSSEIHLTCPAGLWWVRRAWTGSGKLVSMQWLSTSQDDAAGAALQARDGRRLRLAPDKEAEISFRMPPGLGNQNNLRFALRLFGYYEFLESPKVAPIPWPKDWSNYVGKLVTLEGVAINQKIGAALWGEGETIFIDTMDSWPDGYYHGGEQGKRVRVTGTVIERHDLPVFIRRKDVPSVQGIAVPEGTDLHKASHRFLIQNAKWVAVE